MKENGFIGFTGWGLAIDKKGDILFQQLPTFCKRTSATAYCAAQMSVCVFEWLRSHKADTTVSDLLNELDYKVI